MSATIEEMRQKVRELPGLKEGQLEKLGTCAVCRRPLLENGIPSFYVLELSHAVFEQAAISRRFGLSLMMGGHDRLARAFSADEDLAKIISGPARMAVHEVCADKIHHLALLLAQEEKAS